MGIDFSLIAQTLALIHFNGTWALRSSDQSWSFSPTLSGQRTCIVTKGDFYKFFSLFQRTRERNSFVTCKIHRNSVVWTDRGVWCWLFRIQLQMLEKSLTSHAPAWVLPLLDSLWQKAHHLFIIHLLDLLKVNRILDSCWACIQTWNQRCENILECCLQEPLNSRRQNSTEFQILPGGGTFLKFLEGQMSHLWFSGIHCWIPLWPCKAKMTLSDNDVSNPNCKTVRFSGRGFVSYSSLSIMMPGVRVSKLFRSNLRLYVFLALCGIK